MMNSIRGHNTSAGAVGWILLPSVALAFALWALLPTEQVVALLEEGAPVERLTEILYFLLPVAVWALRRPDDDARVLWTLSLVFLAFGAREMDLHGAWTDMSVLKARFYTGDAPEHQKLAGLLVVAVVLAAVGFLFARCGRAAWSALLHREPAAITLACFMATLVVSKLLDRSINVLAEDFGLRFSVSVFALALCLEEVLELSLPLIAGLALLQRRFAFEASSRCSAFV